MKTTYLNNMVIAHDKSHFHNYYFKKSSFKKVFDTYGDFYQIRNKLKKKRLKETVYIA